MSAWPDPERLGVPLNPERDGWHWLRQGAGEATPWHWAEDGAAEGCFAWETDDDLYEPERMARTFTYLGPCLTPTDLEAAVQAERAACAECVASFGDGAFGTKRAALAIRARGNTDALAALRAIAEETQA